MASQVDYTNIWRCDDFQERVDKLCSTLAEKKGRLIVITDFDRCPLLLFCENRTESLPLYRMVLKLACACVKTAGIIQFFSIWQDAVRVYRRKWQGL
jgi:hypothetical protein